ncbi:spore germination protein [Bacillus cereus]|uniref:Putative spore germination protein GerPF n=1 Tax=Bacillus mobilis TaxID=2026190 RepID=A0A1Y5ZWV4_9BACI|nr:MULTISPECIES: spore germination protein [Bacillus cereus group]MBL3741309.1 spore germination protein [Bacillus cereus]MBL3864131.1 spore germination protein [Bacillus cereus]SME17097.1 putative spore germination protein GerPF [Bacillus mobilis]HDR6770133.1 spore germination protein [Bacillus cereus]
MPAIIEGIVIVKCSGNVNVGEGYNVTPISEEKGFHGSGSSNVGKQCIVYSGISVSNINDADTMEGQAFTL